MKKLGEIKQAIKNTPPERLAKTEYQSHFMQMLGVLIVSAILIYKGLWYIVFAFIFSTGVSYSQGIGAYQRYHAILSIVGDKDYSSDKSPTRRRKYIIEKAFGKIPYWVSIIISMLITYFIIGFSIWYQKIAFAMVLIFIHVIIYFFIFYWIAKPVYNNKLKGGSKK